MNVSLTRELEQYVQKKVSDGMYTSASEVIRESLRLMHTHDKLQSQRILQLTQAIDLGMKELEQGKHIDSDDSLKKMKEKINKLTKDNK